MTSSPYGASCPGDRTADGGPLRMRRLQLGLSRADVARATGLGINTVWRAETWPGRARRSTVLLLAAALECDPAAIFPDHQADQ